MLIRKAVATDADSCAPLILQSAPKVLPYLLNDSSSRCEQYIAHAFLQAEGQYGHGNHWVAEKHKQILAVFSCWQNIQPERFHQATLTSLVSFFGLEPSLTILQHNKHLVDSMSAPASNELCIGHFSVERNAHRTGVGRKMIKACLQIAAALKKSACVLDVDEENTVAVAFYKASGFSQAYKTNIAVTDQTFLRMRRVIQ